MAPAPPSTATRRPLRFEVSMSVGGPYPGRWTGVKVLTLAAGLLAGPLPAQVPPGHRLPDGIVRPVRERVVDIQHVAAALRFDMEQERISGRVALTFTPLPPVLARLSL